MAVKSKIYIGVVEVMNGGEKFKEEVLVRAKTKQGALSTIAAARIIVREPTQEDLLKLGASKPTIMSAVE